MEFRSGRSGLLAVAALLAGVVAPLAAVADEPVPTDTLTGVVGPELPPTTPPGIAPPVDPAPWDTPVVLPGVVEAEAFGAGGPGVSFVDSDDVNEGVALREGGIDIVVTPTGHGLGWMKAGEWTAYAVEVPKGGVFDVTLRYAAGGRGGVVHLELDGVDVTGPVALVPTGGWTTWSDATATTVALPAGPGELRLVVDSVGPGGRDVADVDHVGFVAQDPTVPPPTTVPPATVPPTTVPPVTVPPTTVPPVTVPPTAPPTVAPPTAPPTVAPPTTAAPGPTTRVWPASWRRVASAPVPRFEATSVVVGDTIFAFGGFADARQRVLRTYVSYDVPANRWRTLGTLPAGMAETHHGVATDGTYVYLAGGFGGDLGSEPVHRQWISDAVWRFHPASNSWTLLGHLPSPRGGGAMTLLGRSLHYVGGNPTDRVTNVPTHFVYSLDTGRWSTAAPTPDPKDHASAVALGGLMYVVGGQHGHDRDHLQRATVHAYDPATNRWTRRADLPMAKSHTEGGTFVSNGRIVMAGGQVENYAPTRNVVAYDPATNRWSTLSELPAFRQGAVVERVGDRVVVTLGGFRTSQPQRATWVGSLR